MIFFTTSQLRLVRTCAHIYTRPVVVMSTAILSTKTKLEGRSKDCCVIVGVSGELEYGNYEYG